MGFPNKNSVACVAKKYYRDRVVLICSWNKRVNPICLNIPNNKVSDRAAMRKNWFVERHTD